MVVRNEADRYLNSVLRWHSFVDDMHIYDDQSTDDTAHRAAFKGAIVDVRPEGVPSFLEHEGLFRQAAWEAFEAQCDPQLGDWVLLLDADEFVVGERSVLEEEVDAAEAVLAKSLDVRIHEVFDVRGVVPLIRKDGYWPDIQARRIVRYEPGGRFPQRELACGSHPTYVAESKSLAAQHVSILHYGYAAKSDRMNKYTRYVDRPGHSKLHVESILRKPELEPWTGRIPIL